MIDSSPMCGTSEEVAGDLLGPLKARDRAFIATKVWTTAGGRHRADGSLDAEAA